LAEIPPSVIADATGILRGTLTDVLVRLELSGLITRRRNRSDRRQFFAELTPAGRKRCAVASRHYVGAIAKLMRRLDRNELSALDRVLGEIVLGLAEDRHEFHLIAGHLEQLPPALAHILAPRDEPVPVLGAGPENPQVRDLFPGLGVGFAVVMWSRCS
jgi:hypothetical protein